MDATTIEAGMVVLGAIGAINSFVVNALIRTQLTKLNGRYVQSPLFQAKHDALNAKLDSMHAYNAEHFRDIARAMELVAKDAHDARKERMEVTSRLVAVETTIAAILRGGS